VGALLLVAAHQTLLSHDLQEFQHGTVLRRFAPADALVNVAHGAWPAAPEDRQDFQLSVGGPGRLLRHTKTLLRSLYYVKSVGLLPRDLFAEMI
jgi:hypothetical protein